MFEAGTPAESGVGLGLDAGGSAEARRAELDRLIGELAAQVHSLEARLVDAFGELLSLGGATGTGYRSPAHWLSVRTKYTMRDAHELVALAERADVIAPLLVDARAGQLSVGVLAQAARVAHRANADALRDTLRVCTPAQALKVLRTYRSVAPDAGDITSDTGDATSDARDPAPEFVEPGPPDGLPVETWWRHWTDDAGRYRLDAALDPATGALLETAREAARTSTQRNTDHDSDGDSDGNGSEDTPKSRPSTGDIAAELAAAALAHFEAGGQRSRGGERFAIQVTCDLATLAAALGIEVDLALPVGLGSRAYLPATGAHLSDADLTRLACEGATQMLVHHDGEPLWQGTKHRLFTPAQRKALFFRAGHHCEFPGCGATRYLDTHHLDEVADGGLTDIPNGAVVCSGHHHELHRHKWSVTRRGSRLEWVDQWGTPIGVTQLPAIDTPPPPLPGITADTPTSTGGGEPMTPYALDVLLQHLLAP